MTDTAALTEAMTKALTDAGYENVSIRWAPWDEEATGLVGKVEATKGKVWVSQMVTETAARLTRPEVLHRVLVRRFDRFVEDQLKESEG